MMSNEINCFIYMKIEDFDGLQDSSGIIGVLGSLGVEWKDFRLAWNPLALIKLLFSFTISGHRYFQLNFLANCGIINTYHACRRLTLSKLRAVPTLDFIHFMIKTVHCNFMFQDISALT